MLPWKQIESVIKSVEVMRVSDTALFLQEFYVVMSRLAGTRSAFMIPKDRCKKSKTC
jgi:hypothetical protein